MEGANSNSNSNNSSLFANDGSFLERFKQLQEQASADAARAEAAASASPSPEAPKSGLTLKKASFLPSGLKPSSQQQKSAAPAGGKLAFSLKQKSKSIVNPLKLGEDDDEDGDDGQQPAADPGSKIKKSDGGSPPSVQLRDTILPLPTDPEVKKVADKLAHFVAKNGRQFEDLTRKKNPGDTPFRFLFDVNCPDYKYYNYCVSVEEKALGAESSVNGSSSAVVTHSAQHQSPKGGSHQHTNYQTPASALYGGSEAQLSHQPEGYREAVQESAASIDSVSMMEFYMQKAAKEDMRKPYKRSRDEMPPPASLQAPSAPPSKKGHHMGDYIPQEELEKFLAKCSDAKAQIFTREAAERAKIQPDNVGHRLLSKMGWKEGVSLCISLVFFRSDRTIMARCLDLVYTQAINTCLTKFTGEGLGSGKIGRADPVEAGAVKVNNLGVGAEQPGEVNPEDDIYEQYKKRMMLGYRYRPNPLNNPRKAYY